MDLAPVVTGVAAVESKIDDLHRQLVEQRPSLVTSAAESLKQELTRLEEDVRGCPLLIPCASDSLPSSMLSNWVISILTSAPPGWRISPSSASTVGRRNR
jgi:hypothetical protein